MNQREAFEKWWKEDSCYANSFEHEQFKDMALSAWKDAQSPSLFEVESSQQQAGDPVAWEYFDGVWRISVDGDRENYELFGYPTRDLYTALAAHKAQEGE